MKRERKALAAAVAAGGRVDDVARQMRTSKTRVIYACAEFGVPSGIVPCVRPVYSDRAGEWWPSVTAAATALERNSSAISLAMDQPRLRCNGRQLTREPPEWWAAYAAERAAAESSAADDARRAAIKVSVGTVTDIGVRRWIGPPPLTEKCWQVER